MVQSFTFIGFKAQRFKIVAEWPNDITEENDEDNSVILILENKSKP